MHSTSQLSREAVVAELERQVWTYAKSMPWVPHEYVVRHKWDSGLDWEAVVQFMRDHGRPMTWGRKPPKPYFDAGEWRYFTMGSPLSETTVINRERIAGSKAVPA